MCFEHSSIERNPEELKYYKYISINNINYFLNKNSHIFERWGEFMTKNYSGINIGQEIYVYSDKIYSNGPNVPNNEYCRFTFYLFTVVEENGQHANALVVDHHKKIAYRYEPHGAHTSVYNYVTIDNLLRASINSEYTYINPWGYQEINGPQSFEYSKNDNFSGFCLSWSLKFMHLCVLYPDLSIVELDKLMLSTEIGPLSEQIRAYTSFLNSYCEHTNSQIITRSFMRTGIKI